MTTPTLSRISSFTTLLAAAALSALTGCAATPDDVATPEAPVEPVASTEAELKKGGGGTSGGSCVDRWQSCYIGCGVRHPEGDMRDGCEDSCDAAYRLCNIFGGGSSGGVIMR